MNTITIPAISRGSNQLIAVPKNVYKDFLIWQRKTKSKKTFEATPTEKKTIARAKKEVVAGKIVPLSDF